MPDPLVQAGNNAASNAGNNSAQPDNNPAQTQAANANYASANPNVFGKPDSTTPTPMTPSQAFNNTQLPVPTVTSPDMSGAIVAGAKASQDFQNSINPPPTPLEQQQTGLLNDISSLTGQDAGKSQALLNEQANRNVPQDQQAVLDAQKESDAQQAAIATKIAQYDQMFAGADIGKGQLTADVTGQQGAIRLQQAAEIGIMQAQQTAAQAKVTGNQNTLKLALDQASAAVDAKYSTIEDNIKTAQAQLDAIQPSLTREQAKQADIRKAALDKQATDIAYQRDQEKNVASLIVQYPKADIAQTDSLVQASAKAAAWQAQNPGYGAKLEVIGSHYDDLGNKVDTYGFVNPDGSVRPYNSESGQVGNTNLGMSTGNNFGLPTYNTQANNPGVNRPTRNNNPGNIKASATTIKYPGVVGIESTPAADGGNFLIFANPAAGLQSISSLLQNGSSYQNVTAEQAIKKYNGGGGYGAAQLGLDPNKNFQAQIKDSTTLNNVVQNIAKFEGFSGNSNSNTSTSRVGANSSTIDTSSPGYATDLVGKTGLTQAGIDQLALSYALGDSSVISSRSAKGQPLLQANAIKNRAADLNVGGNISANKVQLKTLASNLTQQTEYLNNTQRSLQNFENGFNQITTAFSQAGVNPSESQFANAKINDVNNLFGKNVAALKSFQAGLYEVQNEYAQVASRGGSRNLQGDEKAQALLSGNLSLKDLAAVQNELKQQGDIILNGSQQQVQQIQDQINGIISPGSKQSNTGNQQTVQSNGKSYIVGQVYNDGTANWTVDAQGNWKKQ